jgi:hypothetical protein
LEKDGLRITTQLVYSMNETGERPKDFTEVAKFVLKKAPKATKSTDHHTIIAHTAKIVDRMLRKRTERKVEDVLGEDQFGFRKGQGNRNTIEMLITISTLTL